MVNAFSKQMWTAYAQFDLSIPCSLKDTFTTICIEVMGIVNVLNSLYRSPLDRSFTFRVCENYKKQQLVTGDWSQSKFSV